MTESPVRWGVLGAAGINAAMVPALLAAPNAELVAIASRTRAKATAAAELFGIPEAIEGYEALLADPRIEAVYVPLPNALHREWAIKAAEAGKHVLCEKPMAVTAADAREMAAAASASSVLLAEAFMYVQHPRYARIRAIIESGEIGPVRTIITTFSFDASEELDHSGFQGAAGGGAVYDVGCYAIHSARYLLKAEPLAVAAHSSLSALHGDIDMATSALVEFPDGVALLAHVDMWGADTDDIEIIGASGRISVPHAFICGPDDGDFSVSTSEGTRVEKTARIDHYVAQVERFSDAVRGRSTLLFSAGDAIAGAHILERMSVALRDHQRIEL